MSIVSCSSTSFPWLVFFIFFLGALLWGSMIHKHTGRWVWQGSASVISWNWEKYPCHYKLVSTLVKKFKFWFSVFTTTGLFITLLKFTQIKPQWTSAAYLDKVGQTVIRPFGFLGTLTAFLCDVQGHSIQQLLQAVLTVSWESLISRHLQTGWSRVLWRDHYVSLQTLVYQGKGGWVEGW